MLRRVGHVLLIVALLFATGGHWALLQTVAWTNMLATNLRMCPLEEAITRTFDGQHPCAICKVVCEGKKSEKKSELTLTGKTLEFVNDRPAFTFCAPSAFCLMPEFQSSGDPLAYRPPVPPPRGFLA